MNTAIRKLVVALYLIGIASPKDITSYQTHTLTCYDQHSNYYQETIDDVTLGIKQLTKNEIKELFNNQGDTLFTYRPRIVPLHVSIKNMSNETVVLTKDSIGLTLIDAKRITKRLSYHTSNYTFEKIFSGILISSSLLGAAFSLGTIGTLYALPTLIYAAHTACFLSIIELCVAVPLGSYATFKRYRHENQMIARDTQEKIFGNTLHIPPKTEGNFLIFVHKKKFKLPCTISCSCKKIPQRTRSFTISF